MFGYAQRFTSAFFLFLVACGTGTTRPSPSSLEGPATRISDDSEKPAESRSGQSLWKSAVDPAPFLLVLDPAVKPGATFRLLAVSEQEIPGREIVSGPGALTVVGEEVIVEGGPPHARLYTVQAPQSPGAYPVALVLRGGARSDSTTLFVSKDAVAEDPGLAADGIWQSRREWTDSWERVFSAWIAYLFRPLPHQQNRGWRTLHRVLIDSERNFLHNRLGLGEDDPDAPIHVVARADCGDTPFVLRAYFAWKLQLPFRYRRCTRGSSLTGPRCRAEVDHRFSKLSHVSNPVERFNRFVARGIATQVHSGTMRTLPSDDGSDFYPVSLSREAIRPGTVYVDTGGHVLMITSWDEQGLFAIDGHPDKTVTRRRFSKKRFPFYTRVKTGGFKAFRPIRTEAGEVVPVPNRDLEPFFSMEQYAFSSPSDYYDRLFRLNVLGEASL